MNLTKWTISYSIKEANGLKDTKTTYVFGQSIFEAYVNAKNILKIIERGKIVEDFTLDSISKKE